MTTLVLTVIGRDRPGLVSAVSAPVEAHGGSWERSELVRLAGTFAGVVLVSVPESAVDALTADLRALDAAGLQVRVERTDAASEADGRGLRLHVLGTDRPGIVARVSAAVAGHGMGIDELATALLDAPMAGGELFEIRARLTAADGADLEGLRAALDALADDLRVDVELAEG
ncbi:amino acid-binding ACT protein [Nocardioides sp. TRM66260-LWL]|uniref:glycine cleavage system protein R n=1 Tax=Nocardioides sp. TRM66260-LWL TaxID=2874478 RepID=UPI001CC49EF4|nr:ACT domain-containing protein [Nocardioides sp. TRM66260-LWL]MBZ5735944.1 amino acid-binding ACT protein [Nocardioides sp. TRM66260-LWL]